MPPEAKILRKNKQFWENNKEKMILYAAGGENFEEKISNFEKIIRKK